MHSEDSLSHAMPADQAFVTMATTESYCMGALVVGQCLRRHGTTRRTVVMVSPNVSSQARDALGHVFDQVLVVDLLDSGDRAHLYWLRRPELGVTFTKFHCWTLTQYSKCVFLDADTLVLCNVDELFEREELSAAPDPGWPDCFNSGVFVFRPSLDTHARLLEHARQYGSFDGGDQGLLNTFFSDWAIRDIRKHLPFVYNLSANAIYTYLPAYQEYGHNAKIVHFLGLVKPWNLRSNSQTNQLINIHLEEFVYQWWTEYSYSLLLTKTKWPKEPAGPTQPSVPIQPAVPVQPSVPMQPAVPVQPSVPMQPAVPVQPSVPMQPAVPVQPSVPMQPAVPVPPSVPMQPAVPVQPSDPVQLAGPMQQHSQERRAKPEAREDTVSFIEDLTESLLSEATLFTERPGPPTQPRETHTQPEDIVPWEERGARVSASFQHPNGSSEEGSELTEMAHNIMADHDTEPTETEGHDLDRRRQWEHGHVDYLGKDAFDKIQKKLDRFLDL